MARKRRGKPVNGWLIIDKPLGLSSAQVVGRVRRITEAAKAGHGGTLDPLATGVLPIALGEATKTMAYVMDGSKTYRFTIRWGEARSTDDREGEVVETSGHRPTAGEIQAALPEFTGAIRQVPPAYSAIKLDGKRAYALARAGEDVELAPREVCIERLELLSAEDADHATFEMDCGKGTYVRSLARDLAGRLGTVGHVSMLRRTRVGPFAEERAISLDKLDDMWQCPPPCEHLLPLQTALADIPALAVTGPQADRLRHGQPIKVFNAAEGVVCVMTGDEPVALGEVRDDEVRPLRVFNL